MDHRKFTEDKLLIATSNPEKVKEISRLLNHHNKSLEIISLASYNIAPPEETGHTFEENAILKAKYYSKLTGLACIADDSGIMIDNLDGAPGVYSARWVDNLDEDACIDKTELELNKLGFDHSKASFLCVLSLIGSDGHIENFQGKIDGIVSFPKRGNNGFGYDPIFTPNGYNKTFAELDSSVKNAISHRALAFDQLIRFCFN